MVSSANTLWEDSFNSISKSSDNQLFMNSWLLRWSILCSIWINISIELNLKPKHQVIVLAKRPNKGVCWKMKDSHFRHNILWRKEGCSRVWKRWFIIHLTFHLEDFFLFEWVCQKKYEKLVYLFFRQFKYLYNTNYQNVIEMVW